MSYPLIGLDASGSLPARSVLYHLKPEGQGTPYRESLSSYFLRLADAHSVTPKILANELITPNIRNIRPSFLGRGSIWKNGLFDGIGSVPEEWTGILSQLTGVVGLEDLTLIPMKSLFPSMKLVSQKKKWCPLCLNEGISNGTPYGQLLWSIEVVSACPKHKIKLHSNCCCNVPSLVHSFFQKQLPWICPKCGTSLAMIYEENLITATSEELSHSILVAELLGINPSQFIDLDQKKVVSKFLLHAADINFHGNVAQLAKALGVHKGSLHSWVHQENSPSILQVVNIATKCKVPLRSVLIDGDASLSSIHCAEGIQSRCFTRRTREFPINDGVIRDKLAEAIRCPEPPSFNKVVKELNCTHKYVRRLFPELTAEITRRYSAHIHRNKNIRFESELQIFRKATEELILMGGRVSRRKVEGHLGRSMKYISVAFSKECSNVIKELCEQESLKKK